ncbi:lantibiotic dehydratase [Asanoa siamensis]|uniref:Lantibiotic dehydratase n=1 Tax=Asanoa siamensis TaxID=926357 RepID=A0ABQ4CQL0_9ACTN|nr:lantibiotic dehydratase [Asanoa siamensis]
MLARLSMFAKDALPRPMDSFEQPTPQSRREITRFLADVTSDPLLSEAIALASPSLSAELDQARNGLVEWAALKRIALGVSRYVARIRSRATPFGLMAGVALAHVADRTHLRYGNDHRKVVRPDGEWVASTIRAWEKNAADIPQVRVWLHPSCHQRGERLVLPTIEDYYGPSSRVTGGHQEASVRLTAPIVFLVDLCCTATPIGQVVSETRSAFPKTSEADVWSAVQHLLDYGFLVSELWTALQVADPIARLLSLNPSATAPSAAHLRAVRSAVTAYETSKLGAGGAQLAEVAALTRGGGDHMGINSVQVDLTMDIDFRLPRHVLRHVESAVSALGRVSPARSRVTSLVDYHRDFVEQFGLMNPVPVMQVIDPNRGIGVPAEFVRPPSSRSLRPPSAHPVEGLTRLADAANSALSSESNELELGERLIDHLNDEPDAPVWPSADVTIQIHASGVEAIDHGEYMLSVLPHGAALQAGRTFGRFLDGIGVTETMSAMIAQHDREDGPERVQLQFRPSVARHFNVARAPAQTRRCLWLDGPIRSDIWPSGPDPKATYLSADKLGLYASNEGLHVVDLVDGHEISVTSPHMLAADLAPNLVRLLDRIEELNSRPFRTWSWRTLDAWPRLPRVRYGRSVLYPARWHPLELRDGVRAREAEWTTTVASWQRRLRVPDDIVVSHDGTRTSLNLSTPGDRSMLRRQLERTPSTLIFEDLSKTLGATDWLAGREHELTVPLFATPEARRPARPRIAVKGRDCWAGATERRTAVHFPGEGWAYFRLYVSSGSTDAFLTESLAQLVSSLLDVPTQWFFVRYNVPSEHIRLRIQSDPLILTKVAEWGRRQWARGGLRDFDLATYVPETWRYGPGSVMRSAEALFWRDSQATLAQLGGRIAKRLGVTTPELAAINYLNIMMSLGLPSWREMICDGIPQGRPDGISREQRRRLAALAGGADAWARLAMHAAGRDLMASWRQRSVSAANYGKQLRSRAQGRSDVTVEAVMSLLHMHFNRSSATSDLAERQSLSLLRELVHSQLATETSR